MTSNGGSSRSVVMKVGDLLPALRAQLTDIDGVIQELTGATVRFNLRHRGTSEPILGGDCVVEDEAQGIVRYEWQEEDTEMPGEFEGEFEVTLSAKTITFPNGRHIRVRIINAID